MLSQFLYLHLITIVLILAIFYKILRINHNSIIKLNQKDSNSDVVISLFLFPKRHCKFKKKVFYNECTCYVEKLKNKRHFPWKQHTEMF